MVAGLDMAAKGCGTAARDRTDSALLLRGQAAQSIAIRAEEVGQLQATGRRPGNFHDQLLSGGGVGGTES